MCNRTERIETMSKVTYNQVGYCGSSMSERAVEAYENGERPMSKWTKQAIIEEICEYVEEYNADTTRSKKLSWTQESLNKFSKKVLVDTFLYNSSWHHISKYANETLFYSIDEDTIANLTVEQLKQSFQKEKVQKTSQKRKKMLPVEKGKIRWEEWEGSRRYGCYKKHEEYCLIADDWCYLPDGKKKQRYGVHVLNITTYSTAPKGTAKIYNRLLTFLPNQLYLDYTLDKKRKLEDSWIVRNRIKAAKQGKGLEKLADDEEYIVRKAVAENASKYGREDILEKLADDEDEDVRIKVAEIAGKVGRNDLLEKLVSNEDYHVRYAVAEAAGELGRIDLLEKLAADKDVNVRFIVAITAKKLKRVGLLELLANDENNWVRAEAQNALAKLQAKQ